MKKYAFRIFIFCAFYVLLCFSCKGPLEWNNDIPGFVENGLSTITIRNSVNNADGIEITWLSSLEETVIRINLINPQNHEAEFTMTPTDAALYDSVPLMEVLDNRTLLLTIDPALSAEHGTLDFGLNIYIPSLNRNCPEQLVSFPCDTAPNPVDVVLGGTTDNDKAMTAFRLPASETDDDLVSIEVTWGVAGSTQTVTDTYSIADSGLLDPPADGENLLAGESDLNRYFYPAAAVTGSVYAFTVVLVDNAGRRSVARTATSDIVEYTIIYDSNGADSGNVPAMSTYVFGTQAIISANSGNLGSSGYFFDDWNTSPDGSGEAYTSGQTVTMDAGSLVLYAQWDNYHVVYHSDTGVGGGVVPEETDGYLSGDQATILGYADSGSGVDNLDDHHLLGWDTDIAAHTIVYEPGEVITMPESDVDLYAVWAGIIDSAADLAAVVPDGDYCLAASVDFGAALCDPVCPDMANAFTGRFLGYGFTISNFVLNTAAAQDIGFFGYIGPGGEVRGLTLENVTVSGTNLQRVGTLAGRNAGTIDDCHITRGTAGTVQVTNAASIMVGGFVGLNSTGGSISGCSAGINVYNEGSITGGFVGQNEGGIEGCEITAMVTVQSDSDICGGFAGNNERGSLTFCNVGAGVSVDGTGYIGGLAGHSIDGGAINNCNIDAAVSGTGNSIGGVIGFLNHAGLGTFTISTCSYGGIINNLGTANENIGGLTGYCRSYSSELVEITDCHMNGQINGTALSSYVGGLIGRNITENSAQISISGSTSSASVDGVDYVGGLIGSCTTVSSADTINACTVDAVSVSGTNFIGGLVGGFNVPSGTIEDCHVNGDGFSPLIEGNTCIGGLVGLNAGQIVTSWAAASVSAVTVNAGGLVGDNFGNITSSYASGDVTSGVEYCGGLVGYNESGTITTCYTTDNSVSGQDFVGGLVGRNNFNLTGCYVIGTTNVAGAANTGGLAGMNDGHIDNSYSSADVMGSEANVGGFVGINSGGDISGCHATGTVTDTGSAAGRTGGFAGSNQGAIAYCYATGDVFDYSTDDVRTGGFIGSNDTAAINYCYAAGEVTTSSSAAATSVNTGGFAGVSSAGISYSYAVGNVSDNSASPSINAGGFVGHNDTVSGIIRNCHADGAVDTSQTGVNAGGFAGINDNLIEYSYCTRQVTNGVLVYFSFIFPTGGGSAGSCLYLDDGGTTGPSSPTEGYPVGNMAEMLLSGTYTTADPAWNFTTIWAIGGGINNGYPYLRDLESSYPHL